uniref:MATH domain-containing protein n=1 Tax=Leersia perrieri TaxID=77586 RepID=A0A0D9XJV8_9ORYZ
MIFHQLVSRNGPDNTPCRASGAQTSSLAMPATCWPASAGRRGKPSRTASAPSSSIVADTASGSHYLMVDGFARTKSLPAGERLRSRPFTVGGHHWYFYFHPNGDGAEGTEAAGYISVYLALDEDVVSKPVRASFQFSVGAENRSPWFFLVRTKKKKTKLSPSMANHPGTASGIVADKVTGYHLLKINGYSCTKATPNGTSITSDQFTPAGHDWCIKYYPNGDSADSADYISLHLLLDEVANSSTKRVNVPVLFKFSFADTVTKLPCFTSTEVTIFGHSTSWDWCHPKFIKREDFENSDHLRDNFFTIRCDIIVIGEMLIEQTAKITVATMSPCPRLT